MASAIDGVVPFSFLVFDPLPPPLSSSSSFSSSPKLWNWKREPPVAEVARDHHERPRVADKRQQRRGRRGLGLGREGPDHDRDQGRERRDCDGVFAPFFLVAAFAAFLPLEHAPDERGVQLQGVLGLVVGAREDVEE